MRIALGFEPDPNAVAKNGQDLEFSFEDGGKLVLERYYDHYESKTLPTMVTENGDELAGEDFLASLREDLLTAAGTGAGAGAPGSGSGEYADDPGALIDGINRLGSLGTIYWDRETEVPEAYHGLEFPGGTFDLDVQTSLDGVFSAGVYEDARPYQHQIAGGGPVMPGQIFFTPTLTGTTQVTGIHLSGFHVGSVIEIGQPGDPGYRQIIITSESQVVDFTQADFDGPGVYITPPLNSDADMDITAVVDLVAASSGITDTINGTFTIVVDAVADLPENLNLELGATELSGAITVNESDDANQKLEAGWAKDELVKNTDETNGTGVSVKVPFTATIQFHDYDDGSESHYALIEVPSGANMTAGSVNGVWTLTIAEPNPDGLVVVGTVTLWFNAAGQVVDADDPAAVVSKEFFQIQVPNGAIQAANAGGEYTFTLELESSGANITEDTSFDLLCGSQAVEAPTDGELDPGNNTAWAIANDGNHTQTLTVDTVDSTLTLNLGWFAEGGDGTKNTLTGGAYTAPADVAGATDAGKGALIDLSITAQSGSQNEHITQVTFTFDQNSAGIQYNGAFVQGGDAIPLNGTTYTFSISGDTVTITITGNPVTDLSGLGLAIAPTADNKYSDLDIPVSYTVTVTSADTGAQAVFSGDSKVVVDAVADLSGAVGGKIGDDGAYVDTNDDGRVITENDSDEHSSTTGWETDTFTADYSNVKYGFTVTVSTTFPDTDGSETHYILVEAKPGWSVDTNNLPTGYVLAVPPTITVNGVDFWQIEVTDSTLGSVTVDVPLLVGGPVAGDQSYDIRTGSYVVENDGITPNNPVVDISANNEYDITNNTAVRTDGTTVTYKIDQITSELKVMTGWASEGGKDYKHESATTDNYNPTGGVFDSTENGSAPITISLTDSGSGSAEVISEVVFTFDASRGALVLDSGSSAALTNNGNGTWTLSGNIGDSVTVYFKPHADGAHKFDYSDVDLQYAVTVKSGVGSEVTFKGTSTVVIDAVADKPIVGINRQGEGDLDHNGITYPQHSDGSEQTAAKPGDTVTVHGTVSFPDTSGGEDHYILIRVPSGSGAYTINTVTITGADGNPITIAFDDPGGFQTIANPSGAASGTYYQILVNDTTGQFKVDIEVTMPGGDGNSTQNITYGGYAVVSGAGDASGTGGDYEFDKGNNESAHSGYIAVNVAVVNTNLTMNVGSAYENADAKAHLGFTARADMLDSNGQFNSEWLSKVQDNSATIKFSGFAANESLSAFSLSFTCLKGDDGDFITETGNFMIGDTLIYFNGNGTPAIGSVIVNGETLDYTCTYDPSTGQVILTVIPQDGSFNPATPIYFVPGESYSHTDIPINFAGVVQDSTSGYSKGYENGGVDMLGNLYGELGIDRADPNQNSQTTGGVAGDHMAEIDAVAQQADISDVDVSWGNTTGYGKVPGGQDAKISMKVDLRGDVTDGSEGHVFYVQAVKDYPVQSVTITYIIGWDTDNNPITHTITVTDFTLQKTNLGGATSSTMYHGINIEDAIAKSGNPPMADGKISVEVTVGTPSGSGGTDINMGVMSHEDWNTAYSDKELTPDNNTAWVKETVPIELSSASKPSFIVKDVFYENSNEDAHLGKETWGAGVPIGVNFGDNNDELTGFELKIDNPALGELIIFKTPQDYQDFVDAVDALTAGSTDTPYTLLQQFISGGKAHTCGDEITIEDIDGTEGNKYLDANDNFTGQIIFMPSEKGYSGQDPQLTGTIEVRDTESGQTASNTLNQSIIGDAVAQQPVVDSIDGSGDVNLGLGASRDVTINATFADMDGSTEHFVLIEAGAGWTLTYSYKDAGGNLVTGTASELYTVDGVVYYKIPVDPKVSATDPNTGEVSLDVTLKAPGQEIFAHMDGGKYSFDVMAGSTDNDLRGGELTFHNNTAIADSGEDISGTLKHQHNNGNWIFEQIVPLYEDNNPDKHLATDDPNDAPVGGTWTVGCSNADYVIITVPLDANDDPMLDILTGPDVTYLGNGRYQIDLPNGSDEVEITVTLSETYLDGKGAYNDADLTFDSVIFYKGNPPTEVGNAGPVDRTVIVDAVADRTDTPDVDATYYKDGGAAGSDAVAGTTGKGGEDSVAHFTVDASFPDHDGSETLYVLVEMIPAWMLDESGLKVDTVYLDGKTYYRIDVTDMAKNNGGDVELKIGMTYTGSGANNSGDIFGETDKGVTDYTLSVGTMTQENKLSGVETDLQNNISVNLDGKVTLQYSPIDSKVTLSFSDTEIVESGDGSNAVTLALAGLATELSDELTGLTITVNGKGTLWLDGEKITTTVPLTDAQLAKVKAGETFRFEPDAYSHEDVTFSWTAEVHDTISGAMETQSGSQTLVIDAKADLGDVNSKTEGNVGYEGVASGKDISVTITADFPDDVNASEQHWVVLEQKSPDYKVTGAQIYDLDGNLINGNPAIVTKFDSNGRPYFAVEVQGGGEFKVVFTVTTPETNKDIDFTLQGGAIVIETTKDGADREPDYGNNWTEDLQPIHIKTGVVETVADDVAVSGRGQEGGLCELTFKDLNPEYNETLTITVKGDSLAGGKLYMSDGADGWIAMTPNAPNGTDYVLDGSGKYAYKAADEHASGEFDLKYNATVTDEGSGASKEFKDLTATVTVNGVATPPQSLSASGVFDPTDGGVFMLTLAAKFPDYDGSENHYLLVALPAGLFLEGCETVTLKANNDHNLPEGTYYKVDVADNVENVSTVVPVRAGSDWNGTDNEIAFHAVSQETSNGDIAATSDSATIDLTDNTFEYRTEYVSGSADFQNVSEPLHIYGDDSGNVIIGGSGNDVIYGGSGDDIMSGGAGEDIFAWHLNDLGGMDNILDFELGSDKLFFDSLFNGKDISDMVDDGAVSISIEDDTSLTLTIGLEGGTTQYVDITLAGDGLAGTQYSGMVGELAPSTQSALLEMMITLTN